jgi:hypothetical protein
MPIVLKPPLISLPQPSSAGSKENGTKASSATISSNTSRARLSA